MKNVERRMEEEVGKRGRNVVINTVSDESNKDREIRESGIFKVEPSVLIKIFL